MLQYYFIGLLFTGFGILTVIFCLISAVHRLTMYLKEVD
jgi:hypothetical protein